MDQESKWAKGQDGLLFFTAWQSQTNSEQQENKLQGQNGPRILWLKSAVKTIESNLGLAILTQNQIGPRSQDGSEEQYH